MLLKMNAKVIPFAVSITKVTLIWFENVKK